MPSSPEPIAPADAELIAQVRAGRHDAFGDLIRRYQGAVYGLAYHRLGNAADAQDVAQEAFIKAFRSLDGLEAPDRFGAWLNAITANECRMWRRRHRPRDWSRAMQALSPACGDEVLDWERGQRQAEVARALECLPESQRLLVALRYLSELSSQEIADFLAVTAQIVDARLARARRRLREEMMEMVEQSFSEQQLAPEFPQTVMRELSLTPDGWVTIAEIREDRRTHILGDAHGGKAAAMIALTMRSSDQAAILSGPFDASEAMPKGRGVDCTVQIMAAFRIALKRVVLRLEPPAQCRASGTFAKGRSERTLEMRPSDALALAARLKAPILAEEAVIAQGKLGEDGLECDLKESLDELRLELRACNQSTELTSKPFEIGLHPEAGIRTARFRRNEAANTLTVSVEGSDGEPSVLDLGSVSGGVRKLWGLATAENPNSRLYHDGAEYVTRHMLDGDDLLIEYVLAEHAAVPER